MSRSLRPTIPPTIEEVWRKKLDDAGLTLDFARLYVKELQGESGAIPENEYNLAYQRALRAQELASDAYSRVLKTYGDLVVKNVIPA